MAGWTWQRVAVTGLMVAGGIALLLFGGQSGHDPGVLLLGGVVGITVPTGSTAPKV